MKAIHLKQFGIENLVLTDEKIPTPGPRQVLVRIEAVALNYLDIAVASGTYNPTLTLPRIPTSDGAGTIDGIGAEVTRWKKGDRVMVNFYQKWISGRRTAEKANSITGQATPGLLAEYVCIDEEALVRTPANLTSEEAATLPIAGVTAWNGWFVHAGLKPGQTVLTQGTGGVSIFALQLAKLAGARVIATSGSDAKLDVLRKLGADEVIHYKNHPQWHEEVLRLTQQQGVDATLDIGGADSIDSALRAMRHGGFIGLVGFLGGAVLPVDFFKAVTRTVRLQAISVGTREDFEDLARAVEVTGLKPVVSAVFAMENVQEAFRYMQGGGHVGKVVVRV